MLLALWGLFSLWKRPAGKDRGLRGKTGVAAPTDFTPSRRTDRRGWGQERKGTRVSAVLLQSCCGGTALTRSSRLLSLALRLELAAGNGHVDGVGGEREHLARQLSWERQAHAHNRLRHRRATGNMSVLHVGMSKPLDVSATDKHC